MLVAMARTMQLGIQDRKQPTHIEPYPGRRHRPPHGTAPGLPAWTRSPMLSPDGSPVVDTPHLAARERTCSGIVGCVKDASRREACRGVTRPTPLKKSLTAGNRCAEGRLRRSRATVDAAVNVLSACSYACSRCVTNPLTEHRSLAPGSTHARTLQLIYLHMHTTMLLHRALRGTHQPNPNASTLSPGY